MEYNDKNTTEEIAKIEETENFDEETEFDTEEKHHHLAKLGHAIQSLGARNIAVICSVLLIGAAVVLNFTLFGDKKPVVGEGDALSSGTDDDDESFVEIDKSDAYFATAELSRKQARDQAIAVLQTVVDSSTAEAIAKEQASDDISRIASEIQTEANIETLIKSKGFEKCVAVISDGTASVIVESDGLLPNELSQIKEIVWEQAGIDPVNIKIIEKKSV